MARKVGAEMEKQQTSRYACICEFDPRTFHKCMEKSGGTCTIRRTAFLTTGKGGGSKVAQKVNNWSGNVNVKASRER